MNLKADELDAHRYIYKKQSRLRELLGFLDGPSSCEVVAEVEISINNILRDIVSILESNYEEITAPMVMAYINAILGEVYDTRELSLAYNVLKAETED